MVGGMSNGVEEAQASGVGPRTPTHPLAQRGWAGTVAVIVVWSITVVLVVLATSPALPQPDRIPAYAAAAALLLVGRGLWWRRPITARHLTGAAIGVVVAATADVAGLGLLGFLATVLAGVTLVSPTGSRPDPALLPTLLPLVDRTPDDPLAPFVLHSQKSYFLNGQGTAAVGYRTRFGIAVVGGDPVGDPLDFGALVAEFTAFCRRRGWRIAVLGAGERCRALWAGRAPGEPGLRAVAFGRDVVLDARTFSLQGRGFRNLRQAVNRTHNAGVSTRVIAESAVDEPLRGELLAVARAADRGDNRRGFSMILDRLLTGELPGLWLVIAEHEDRVVGFQRYATADGGREVSLDVPCRRPDAPNGTDERMTLDMLDWARSRGAQHLSLSFAAFPELFDDPSRGWVRQLLYRTVHLSDGLLEMESLYAFLRKFHALGQQRFVMFTLRAFLPSVTAMLTLEFLPHRHPRVQRGAGRDVGAAGDSLLGQDAVRPGSGR